MLIDRLVEECPPLVAFFPAVPDEIAGWVCRSTSIVHYLYVKAPYRRAGIGMQLCAKASFHTHRTPRGEQLLREVGSQYNPFILSLGAACLSKP